jgi:hypothetical protein
MHGSRPLIIVCPNFMGVPTIARAARPPFMHLTSAISNGEAFESKTQRSMFVVVLGEMRSAYRILPDDLLQYDGMIRVPMMFLPLLGTVSA